MSSIPNDKDFVVIADSIGFGWEFLAAYMSIDRPTVERLKMDHTRAIDQCYHLLLAWKRKVRNDATYEKLFTSIRDCEKLTVDWTKIQTHLGFGIGKKAVFRSCPLFSSLSYPLFLAHLSTKCSW